MSIAFRAARTLLPGIVIFAGLPFVGWGVKDSHGFIAHPARFSYITLAILLQVLIVIKFPEAGRSRSKGKKLVHRQRVALVLLQITSLAIIVVARVLSVGVRSSGQGA